MRTEIITCDGPCGAQLSVVHRHASIEGEFCFEDLQKLMASAPEECPHEDNASDQVSGRSETRLVCKACGYDRMVNVEEAVA